MISTFTLSLDARCALARAYVVIAFDEDAAEGLYGTARELAREVGRADSFAREAGALLAGEAYLPEAWREGQVDRLWDIIYVDAAISRRIADHMDPDTLHVESLRAYATPDGIHRGFQR